MKRQKGGMERPLARGWEQALTSLCPLSGLQIRSGDNTEGDKWGMWMGSDTGTPEPGYRNKVFKPRNTRGASQCTSKMGATVGKKGEWRAHKGVRGGL